MDKSDNTTLKQLRQNIFDYTRLMLGDEMVEVEADPIHYNNALAKALDVFRTYSSAAVEEGFAFLELFREQQFYTLPENIQYVMKISRRSVGDFNNGSEFDAFSQATLNTFLLNAGNTGGLLSFELYTDYLKTVDRLFGGNLDFNFNSVTKKLTIFRKPIGDKELVALQCFSYKPEIQLLSDHRTILFFKEYVYAMMLETIGQARGKFGTVIGPSGGISLNGPALLAQSSELKKELIENIKNYRYGESALGIFIG
jgi:hypothetical protein